MELLKKNFDKLILLALVVMFTVLGIHYEWSIRFVDLSLGALLGLLTGHHIAQLQQSGEGK